jgi:hemoglobin
MHDIQNEIDVALLIENFYKKVIPDPLIGPFFTDVVQFSWEEHIPIMNKFWGSVLLGSGSYGGNPMVKHFLLDKKSNLNKIHFDRWLELWEKTVNENFSGDKASDAILRAKNIAGLMQHKIVQNRNFQDRRQKDE